MNMGEKQIQIIDKLLNNILSAVTYPENCDAVNAYKEFLLAVEIHQNVLNNKTKFYDEGSSY